MASRSRGVEFLLLRPDGVGPGWWDAALFDLLSDYIPSTWRVQLGSATDPGFFQVGPRTFLRPGFFEDFWADAASHEIREEFDREVELIMREENSFGQ
jgi:hypothetical protein